MSNIIDAIVNLVKYKNINLVQNTSGNNRANNAGDGLEEFVKNLFAGTFNDNEAQRLERISQIFSYLGNKSNPPDAMLKNGDALEVKKIENASSALALNSSHPKNKLYATSPMISKSCKYAENWDEKDIMYIVGLVESAKIKKLSIVYGMDYCAEESCYLRIKNAIKETVENIPSIDFSESRELGHINKVDPLGITYMRIRGMWGIENPWKAFSYAYKEPSHPNFSFMCIINEKKWNSLTNHSELQQLETQEQSLKLADIKIKHPDNPAILRNAKLITFGF